MKRSINTHSENYVYSADDNQPSTNGIVAKLNWDNAENFNGDFSLKLNLKGSRRLDFIPAGKTTDVKISGEWNNPSFDGEFLPTSREISETNFNAAWKILHFNRPFAQSWTEQNQELSGADFGVRLLVRVRGEPSRERASTFRFDVR